MKSLTSRLAFIALFVVALASPTCAQTPADQHSVTLAWEDTKNPVGTTWSVYRAFGLCSGTAAWSKIASALTEKTYIDTTVQPGNYCFHVTATFNGMESAPSNLALAPVPSFPPSQLGLKEIK